MTAFPTTRTRKGPTMQDRVDAFARDWLTLALAALGVNFHAHEWLGGMLLALAMASLARHLEPERDRRELYLVFLTAFLVAHLTAVLWVSLAPETWTIPKQIPMALSGFASRRIVGIALRIITRIEDRTEDLVDRGIDRVLPTEKKETHE